MAPTAPKKRPSIRSKTTSASTSHPSSGSGLSLLPKPHRPNAIISDTFISYKKDKRLIKSNSFLHRIQKSHSKPSLKRRRPNKKLTTTLEGLADALPDVEDVVREGQGLGGGERGNGGKIKMKSLRSRPGALKRKGKLEERERERFGRNLAVMMGTKESGGVGGGEEVNGQGNGEGAAAPKTTNRFAALRAWAEQNMEKHPAFEKKA